MTNFGCVLWFMAAISCVNAFFLMGVDKGVFERIDPIVNPNGIASHAHIVGGGGNFGSVLSTEILRQSKCTSTPISEDKSSYWTDTMYFQWKNGSFTSLDGGFVIYYLFPGNVPAGTITAFPDDFRMISGTPTLRTYNASSHAQQAITFLCLDFNGVSTKHNEIPVGMHCPSGIRAQVNFPSCWDGINVDSPDHKSHVAFPSGGPDSGTCSDPRYPKTLPRIFMELYWSTGNFDYSQAMRPEQPFVLSQGDPTGYGHHADYFNGWDKGVLQRVVDECTCPEFGDPTCCAQKGIFTYNSAGNKCPITPTVNEQVVGTLDKLPGNNPVTGPGAVVPVPSSPSSTSTTTITSPSTTPVSVPSASHPTSPSTSTTVSVSPPASQGNSPSATSQSSSTLSASSSASPASSPAKSPIASPSDKKPPAVPSTPVPSSTSSAEAESSVPAASSSTSPASTSSASDAQSTDGANGDECDEDEDESPATVVSSQPAPSSTSSAEAESSVPAASSSTSPASSSSASDPQSTDGDGDDESDEDEDESPATVVSSQPAPSATSSADAQSTDEGDDEGSDSDEPTVAGSASFQAVPTTTQPATTPLITTPSITTVSTTTQPPAPLVTMIKNGQKCIVRPGSAPPTLYKKAQNISPASWNVARSKFISHRKAHRHFQRMIDVHF